MPRVLVVGAGVVGSAVAMRLAEAGVPVTVVEAARPGTGTSASSFAWFNANEKTPEHYYELNLRGMREHRVLASRSAQWFHGVGNLEWADAGDAADLVARVERLRSWGYAAHLISRSDAESLEPAVRVPAGAGVFAYFPEEGYVDGDLLVGMLLAHARNAGAQVITGVEVLDLVVTGGRVSGVRLGPTAGGRPDAGRGGADRLGTARLSADVVVLCAGLRTAALAGRAGGHVPLVAPEAPGSAAVCLLAETEPPAPPGGVRRVVHASGLIMRPGRHGGVLVEPDYIPVGLTYGGEPPAGPCQALLDDARLLLPGLRGKSFAHPRLCVRPLPDDRYPIVGWCPDLDGCYVAVTHSGITLAPYLSTLVCRDLVGGDGAVDAELAPYRPQRFVGVA